MKDITIIIPLHDVSAPYIEMSKKALDSVKKCEEHYKSGKLIPMFVIPSGYDCPVFEGYENITFITNGGKTDFCSQVNKGVSETKTDYFSILEVDDTYAPKWFKMCEEYWNSNEDVSIFLPINVQSNADHTKWQYANELPLAMSFSNEIGVIDKDCLENCSTFNLTGAVFNTSDFIEAGMLKPSIKVAFYYELMLRYAEQGLKMLVVPKEGYYHVIGRKDSLSDIYAKEIPDNEISLWFDLAKRECVYKTDRWKTIVMPKKETLK